MRESKRDDPAASPYRLRAPAQQIRAERAELERTISGLEKGIEALRVELEVLGVEQAAKKLAEATLQARKLTEEECEVVRAAGALISSMVPRWNDRVRLLHERSALAERVRVEGLASAVRASRADLVGAWEAASAFPLQPVPTTFAAFLDELIEAATAPRVDVEAERRAIDDMNARRRVFAARNPGSNDDLPPLAYPEIRPNPLDALVPDLRGQVHTAEVTGAATRRASGPVVDSPAA